MSALLKVAAAVLVATTGFFIVRGPRLVGASVLFEEVAQKIHKAHTLAYTVTMQLEDPGRPQSVRLLPQSVRLLFKEPGLMRCESIPAGGSVVILNSQEARKLVLDPAKKSALILEGRLPGEQKPGDQDIAASTVADLRRLAEKKAGAVGEKLIGTINAQGFRADEAPGFETTVWVDPTSRLPLQVEITGPFGDKTFHSTLTDIHLDPALDDGLFSLVPPEGYSLQKQDLAARNDKDDDGTPEAALRLLLRTYADKSSGTFPKQVDDWNGYAEALAKSQSAEKSAALAMRVANILARAAALVMTVKNDSGYQPEGIKLGDADKVLFWYKPKGKETYRAIFGDLHSADVTADKIPVIEKPKTKP